MKTKPDFIDQMAFRVIDLEEAAAADEFECTFEEGRRELYSVLAEVKDSGDLYGRIDSLYGMASAAAEHYGKAIGVTLGLLMAGWEEDRIRCRLKELGLYPGQREGGFFIRRQFPTHSEKKGDEHKVEQGRS